MITASFTWRRQQVIRLPLSPKYSAKFVGVKSQKDQFNIILIKRQTDALPSGASGADFEKAEKEDNKLLKILDKDAKAEGKWNY
jgi:hypothetical protein